VIKKMLLGFTSRKFHVVILATVVFFASDRFSDLYLFLVYLSYCGVNVLQKKIEK